MSFSYGQILMSDEKLESELSHDDRLADVIERYLAAAESGSAPSRTALMEEHPDLAADLDACLQTLEFIGNSLGQGPATSVLECGQQFGEYQILRELGRGGMGVVYEAFHLGLERRVALKVLSGRSFEDARQRERFLQEAKTAASLHHTNIVPIFEVGELDGVCYYAMQYIAGESLGSLVRRLGGRSTETRRHDTTIFPPGTIVRDERVAAGNLTLQPSDGAARPLASPLALSDGPVTERYFREVTRLVAQAADALSHAHVHGVVHRDVKPSNFILDREGRVWVTDFGLAFRSDAPDQKGDAVGTPAYMSPEQVRPGWAAVDHRTDIYSLGATLYEMLTLRPIFEGESSLAVLTQIAATDPVPPLRHNWRIPKDLDCIVRRAIAKRPEDRYREAADMADDLKRYLNHEPVRARQIGPVARLVLWCRREPRLAGVTTAAALLLLVLSVISHWAILRARNAAVRSRDQAEKQLTLTTAAESKATENLRQALFQQARATASSLQNGRRWATLDLIRQAQAIRPDPTLRDEAIGALSISDARLVKQLAVDKTVERLAFCSARPQIAFICGDGSVRLWNYEADPSSAESQTILAASGYEHDSVALSACGRYLAAVDGDGSISVWDTSATLMIAHLDLDDFRPRFLAFLANQTMLVALNAEGQCRSWEFQDGGFKPRGTMDTMRRWQAAVAGPDSHSITLLSSSGEVVVWDVATGDRQSIEGFSPGRSQPPITIQWDTQGKRLAVGQRSETVDVWSEGHAVPRSLGGHHGTVRALAFHPQENLLSTSGSRDSAMKLWDMTTGDLIALLHEPLNGSVTASFSEDGRFLAAAGRDRVIWLWEFVGPKSFRRWAAHEDVVTQVAINPAGTLIASGSADGSITLWPSDTPDEPTLLAPRVHDREQFRTDACAGLMFSSDGKLIASRLRNSSIRVWDVESHELVASIDSERNMRSGGAAFLPNSHEIVRSSNNVIERWNLHAESDPVAVAKAADRISAMALSPAGDMVSVCTSAGLVQVFELASGKLRGTALQIPAQGVSMAIDQTGERLAVGDRSGSVHLIGLLNQRLIKSWVESSDEITEVAFSPDGRWLGVSAQDGRVRLHGMPDAELLATFTKHEGSAWSLAFGPASRKLVTCGDDKLVHVWNLDSLREELAALGLAW
jgi:serine/threonine protein kinase/WD40 repeat protein